MIDTHCHLDFESFQADLPQVIQRATSAGVTKMITIGCDLERSHTAVDIAVSYENVFATIGIHPCDVHTYTPETWASLEALFHKHASRIVGFGETGLDYYRLEGSLEEIEAMKLQQKKLFEAHLLWSSLYHKPVSIHTRSSIADVTAILLQSDFYAAVMHCFTESWDDAQKLLTKDTISFSFGGIVTFDKTGQLADVISRLPLDRIMLETDAPFLAPQPFRGKRNEPAYMRYTAEKIAEIRGMCVEEVIDVTTRNAERFWGI